MVIAAIVGSRVSIPESLRPVPPGRPVACSSARHPWASLGDASKRLIDALSNADVVAAEDTRRVRARWRPPQGGHRRPGDQPVRPERGRPGAGLVADIAAGATVLLVSDAGMPLINDPGYRMVTACVEAGLMVSLPAGAVRGDHRAGGLGPAVGPVLLRGFARASSRASAPGWPHWPPSPAPRCSSSRRGGSRTACGTPSINSARSAAPWCAGNRPRPTRRSAAAPSGSWRNGRPRGAGRSPSCSPGDTAGRRGGAGCRGGSSRRGRDAGQDACATVVDAHPGAAAARALRRGAAFARHVNAARFADDRGGLVQALLPPASGSESAVMPPRHRAPPGLSDRTRRCGSPRSAHNRPPAKPSPRCRSTRRAGRLPGTQQLPRGLWESRSPTPAGMRHRAGRSAGRSVGTCADTVETKCHTRGGSHDQQFGHRDRTGSGDPAEVVAHQVDDHDVLRDVLARSPQIPRIGA